MNSEYHWNSKLESFPLQIFNYLNSLSLSLCCYKKACPSLISLTSRYNSCRFCYRASYLLPRYD